MEISFPDHLVVGVDEIDEQHRRIFQAANEMLAAMSRGKGQNRLFALLQFLDQHVRDHFALEEKYMLRHDYPGCSEHQARHREFSETFAEFQRRFETEGATVHLVVQTTRFLCDWLQEHIRSSDLALVEFLKPKL